MNRLVASATLFLVAVLAGCTPASITPSPAGGTPTGAATSPATAAVECLPDDVPGDVQVSIVDFGFEPASASAGVGQTVTWSNTGQAPHTVTFRDNPDCGQAAAGAQVSVKFNAAATYEYFCRIHPTMEGSVTVNP